MAEPTIEEMNKGIDDIIERAVVNFSKSIPADTIKSNVEYERHAGMRPRIIRSSNGKCCEWCSSVAGEYYADEAPDDIYKRHDNCTCTVTYISEKGYQDAHTKAWITEEETDARRERIQGDQEYIERLKKENDKSKTLRLAENRLSQPQNVTGEYLDHANPGRGEFVLGDETEKFMSLHNEEIEMAQWIHSNLGGDIKILSEDNVSNVLTPDYIWNGAYWDLKTISTEKAPNSAIRHGLRQIKDNPGGIILNCGNKNLDINEIEKTINRRMKWCEIGEDVDIVIIKNNKLVKALRYK